MKVAVRNGSLFYSLWDKYLEGTEKEEGPAVLRFVVADTGTGIPEDQLESIFTEFAQASYEVNLKYGGTGLGLSISQKLLQLYGSKMQVKSTEGKGSEFSFEINFPLNKEKPKQRFSEKVIPELFESARILVVDDSPVNIYIISEY